MKPHAAVRPLDQWIAVLLATILLASMCTIAFQTAGIQVIAEVDRELVLVEKGPGYYAALSAMLAGIALIVALLFLNANLKRDKNFLIAYALLCAAGLPLLRNFTTAELLSTRIVDVTGPAFCIGSALALAGMRRGVQENFDKIMQLLTVVASIAVAVAWLASNARTRVESTSFIQPFANQLYWGSAWLLLFVPRYSGRTRRSIVAAGIVMSLAAAVVTQTRLNFVMLLLLFLCWIWKVRREPKIVRSGLKTFSLCLVISLLALFANVELTERLVTSYEGFLGRIDEDSRSNQIYSFFQSVPIDALIFGSGARATWNWNGLEWDGGTDVGFLSLLFYGGIPLLLSVVWTVVLPAARAATLNLSPFERTSCYIVGLWTVRMLSSTYPTLSCEYLVILLCAGSLWGALARWESRAQGATSAAARGRVAWV